MPRGILRALCGLVLLFVPLFAQASDIHFEPEANFLRIRYRIDGMLRQIRALHKSYWPAIPVRHGGLRASGGGGLVQRPVVKVRTDLGKHRLQCGHLLVKGWRDMKAITAGIRRVGMLYHMAGVNQTCQSAAHRGCRSAVQQNQLLHAQSVGQLAGCRQVN